MNPFPLSGSRLLPLQRKSAAGNFLAALLLLVVGAATAQDFYYLKTRLPNPAGGTTPYQSLLTLKTDGTVVSRTVYTDPSTKEQRLVEQAFLDSTGPDETHYLLPTEPVYVDTFDATGFVAHALVFEKSVDTAGTFYRPASVLYRNGNGQWQPAATDTIQSLAFAELKRWVPTFYDAADPFYDYLFADGTRGALSEAEKRTTLYLIGVTKTRDASIGPDVAKDSANLMNNLRQICSPIRLVSTFVSADRFTKKNVEAALLNVRPAKNDIVLFYYSGHGFRYPEDKSDFPRLSLRKDTTLKLRENNLAMQDIYQKLKAKGARLTIVMSDCCNNIIEDKMARTGSLLRPKNKDGTRAGLRMNEDNFRALFLPKQRRSIIISSTSKTEKAAGTPEDGGFYTAAFLGKLKDVLYSGQANPSWPQLLDAVGSQATADAGKKKCKAGFCKQHAVTVQE